MTIALAFVSGATLAALAGFYVLGRRARLRRERAARFDEWLRDATIVSVGFRYCEACDVWHAVEPTRERDVNVN